MQIKITTDYGIRSVLYLASHSGVVTAQEISEGMCIPMGYTAKVLRTLRKAGLIHSQNGSSGGHQLTKDPSEITMLDIVDPLEGTIRINRCLEDDGYCSRNGVGTCPVHVYYEQLQQVMLDYLSGTTVADILNGTQAKTSTRDK